MPPVVFVGGRQPTPALACLIRNLRITKHERVVRNSNGGC